MGNSFTTTVSSADSAGLVTLADVLTELGISSTATANETLICQAAITRATGAIISHLRYDPIRRSRTEYYPQMSYGGLNRESVWEANDTVAYAREISEAAGNELYLKHLPIRSISSLYIDYDARGGARAGSFAASSLKVEGTDFWPNYDCLDSSSNKVCNDGVLRSIGLWPTQAGSVKVTYTAGYSSDEIRGEDNVINASPLWVVALDESVRRAKKAFFNAKRTGIGFLPGVITNENLGDYSYSIDSAMANKLFGGSWDLTPESMMKLQPFANWGYNLAP